MTSFEFEIETVGGLADSDVLDRLAAHVYEIDDLVDPLLALNDDGSLTASFVVVAQDALTAAKIAADRFSDALADSAPLSDARPGPRDGVGRFQVREAALATG